MIEIKNAIIKSVSLSTEDHGLLSAWINLDYGGSGQGFGGYCLYTPRKLKEQGNYAGHFIYRVLEVVSEVGKWEELVGKSVRVKAEHGKVHAIGNILTDEWFNPTEEFEEMINDANRGT